MEYFKIFEKLSEKEVRYLICGGMAVNIYGIPRMTADIDIVVDFTLENLESLDSAMKELGYKPILPFNVIELAEELARKRYSLEKNLKAYSYFGEGKDYFNVDIIIDLSFNFDEAWKLSETRKVDELELHLVSIESLIKMKEEAGRDQDKKDAEYLKKLKDGENE
jgi:hypothetical protein